MKNKNNKILALLLGASLISPITSLSCLYSFENSNIKKTLNINKERAIFKPTVINPIVNESGIPANGNLTQFSAEELIGSNVDSSGIQGQAYLNMKKFVATNITSILDNYDNSPTLSDGEFGVNILESDTPNSVIVNTTIPRCSISESFKGPKEFNFLVTGLNSISSTFVLSQPRNQATLLSNVIPQLATSEENKDVFYEYLIDNCFSDLPSNSNILDISILESNNLLGQLTINSIVVSSYYNTSKQVVNSNQTFNANLTISGFKKINPTSVIPGKINTNIVGVNLSQVDTNSSEELLLVEKASEWLRKYYNIVFENLPSSNSFIISDVSYIKGSVSQEDKSASFNVKLRSYYDDNELGTLIIDGEKNYNLTLSNINLVAPEQNNNQISIWVWIGVGIGSAILLIAIIIAILLILKKKNKKKSNKVPQKIAPIQNNRLVLSNNVNSQINNQQVKPSQPSIQRPGQPIMPSSQVPQQQRLGQMNTVQGTPQIPGQPVRPGQPIRPGQAPQPQRPTPPPPIITDRGPRSMAPKLK